jgi:type IV secretory pathway TraG/TraD family ATPase VirD4
MDSLIATSKSNKVATTLGVQDFSRLRKNYGKEQADVIMNITGNIISGQVTGDTAKQLSERLERLCKTGLISPSTALTLPLAGQSS